MDQRQRNQKEVQQHQQQDDEQLDDTQHGPFPVEQLQAILFFIIFSFNSLINFLILLLLNRGFL